jgi:Bacterial archaeo-eukaryotic release factor family 2
MMQPEQFRSLLTARGPFVSVYLDDSRDVSDPPAQMAAVWRDLRKHLEHEGADAEVIAALEQVVLHGRPAVGHQGLAVIATPQGIALEHHLKTPPTSTLLRISDYPYLLPLLDLGGPRAAYLLAAVDREGADLTVRHGAAVRTESIEGDGYPVHKPASAGWSGYSEQQHNADEAIRINARAVAARMVELADQTDVDVVFVSGPVPSRAEVVAELPKRVAERVVELAAGSQGHRAREHEVAGPIEEEFQRRQAAEGAELADRVFAQKGRGSELLAEGLPQVCAALRAGSVETLVIGDLADATVVLGDGRTTVAPDAETLSELGEAPRTVARADEALPFAALSVDAAVAHLPHLDVTDGVAALLRYPATGSPGQ